MMKMRCSWDLDGVSAGGGASGQKRRLPGLVPHLFCFITFDETFAWETTLTH